MDTMCSFSLIPRGNSFRDRYKGLVEFVAKGDKQSPRGITTFERLNSTIHLESMLDAALPLGIGRGVSTKVFAAEAMQWLGGVSDLRQLESVSAVFAKFSDDGVKLNGAYGPRAFLGLGRAVRILNDDSSSRQATVSIWSNLELDVTKDLPCTVAWSFAIRDGQLHMTTYMRSNDVWTGLAYDLPIMARIGSAMASALNVSPGSYTHHAQSLHLYESDLAKIDLLHEWDGETVDPPFFDGIDYSAVHHPVGTWRQLTQDAVAASRSSVKAMPEQFKWYANTLFESLRYPTFCEDCRYYTDAPVTEGCRCGQA